jgi:hypothetical protein
MPLGRKRASSAFWEIFFWRRPMSSQRSGSRLSGDIPFQPSTRERNRIRGRPGTGVVTAKVHNQGGNSQEKTTGPRVHGFAKEIDTHRGLFPAPTRVHLKPRQTRTLFVCLGKRGNESLMLATAQHFVVGPELLLGG